MEKLNKVIAGLECCGTDAVPDRCPSCPYEHSIDLTCVADLMDDALELLRNLQKIREDYECGLIMNYELPEMLW